MKLNQLTFTRFIAAFSIVIYHFGLGVKLIANNYFLHQLFSKAYLAVGYFFILSGFVMVIAYGTKDLRIKKKDYYINRIARIYPMYFVALLLSVLFSILTGAFVFKNLILNVFAIQAWWPKYTFTLNPAAWSLSVEFLFYFLFPILLNSIYRRWNFQRKILIIISVWIAMEILFCYLTNFSGNNVRFSFLEHYPIVRLNEFLLGNLLGFIFLKSSKNKYDFLLLLNVGLIILVLYNNLAVYVEGPIISLLFSSFIILSALNVGVLTKLFSFKFFVVLGEISYSFYILQFPIYWLCRLIFKHYNILNPNIVLALFCLMLLLASWISFYAIESPANTNVKKVLRKYILSIEENSLN